MLMMNATRTECIIRYNSPAIGAARMISDSIPYPCMKLEYTLTIPIAKGVAMTAEIKRNITDIITEDFLSLLSALPSRIIPKTLSSSFDFNLLLIALHASSKLRPIRISMIVLLISSYSGPSPYCDMSSIAFSKLSPV